MEKRGHGGVRRWWRWRGEEEGHNGGRKGWLWQCHNREEKREERGVILEG